MILYKYPDPLLTELNLPNNSLLTEKDIFQHIINKCSKVYGNKYKIPTNIYIKLVVNNTHIINNKNGSIFINSTLIKKYLKKIAIQINNNNNLLSISDIYSNIPVSCLTVII